jgi:hypothetical protein
MDGLIGFAPIYLNGLFAVFVVFVLPGLLFVELTGVRSFPQRWSIIFLASLTTNFLLVTAIGILRLNPLLTYRTGVALLVATFLLLAVKRHLAGRSGSPPLLPTMRSSDLFWLLSSLAVLGITYVNIWKHGTLRIFDEGDVSISWNTWAQVWAHAGVPPSIGYPQFIPTIWAVTYIFTGSPVQYFAYLIYLILIVAPHVLNAMNLGRLSWWSPCAFGLAFVWLIAEISDPWMRASFEQGYPDWTAAIFVYSGVALFIANDAKGISSENRITNSLIALCFVLIATVTKPLYGLFAITLFAGTCVDAFEMTISPRSRNRLIGAAAALLTTFALAYLADTLSLNTHGMPNYPVTSIAERFGRAINLINASFTLPFQILLLTGLLLCPFLARLRWLALALWGGVLVWATTASYDLRNLLGFLLVCASIPVFAAARAWFAANPIPAQRSWPASDLSVAGILAIVLIGLSSTFALGDRDLSQRFNDDQLRHGPGLATNETIGELLNRGCTIFTASAYVYWISVFEKLRDQMHFFHYNLPLTSAFEQRFNNSRGCVAVLYPIDLTHPSIQKFIDESARTRDLATVINEKGMTLLASPLEP